ncbi:MAG: four helix bundle protein [Verrucomicrobiota bacterium]|jgi:four helix bundle protein
MAYQSFEELEVWKRACRLAVDITRVLSETKQFALRDQMVRAAISIPSNIAEGAEHACRRDFIRFLRIAKGSAAELRTQSYIASRLDIMDKASAEKLVREIKEISAMLQGLIRSLSPTQPNTEH